jgi:hypothetical protein
MRRAFLVTKQKWNKAIAPHISCCVRIPQGIPGKTTASLLAGLSLAVWFFVSFPVG